ncbi:hypothetical protein ACVBEH_29315, partial [Roseateles sp. GG27B]
MAGAKSLVANTPISLQAQALVSKAGFSVPTFKLKAADALLDASGELTLATPGSLTQGWQAKAQASAQAKDLRQFWRGGDGLS